MKTTKLVALTILASTGVALFSQTAFAAETNQASELKSNGVILSTFLAHLFMDCSIFLLHKTGILKHVIRKI